MERVQCRTQIECDAALAAKNLPILIGDGWFRIQGESYVEAWESSHVVARESSHVVAWGSSHVEAWGSSYVEAWGSSYVEAWESSHVEAGGSSHVEAWESSHVEARESSHVEAWESSHVEARESSHVVARESSHVVARESSHVEAWGSSHVEASKFVAIHQHSDLSKISGGVVIPVKAPATPIEWCEFYGAEVADGCAILFKAVDQDFRSGRNFQYSPGTVVEATDWDGGREECGGGLHFCATPLCALAYHETATRFVACPVKLEDIAVHLKPNYPNKIKARAVSRPIYEVDRYGKPLEAQVKQEQ